MGGFIPWDDDVDIAIPISQMENFARCAAQEFPENMYVDTAFSSARRNKTVPDSTRIHNSDYTLIDKSGLEYDAYIDVLAIVGMPANPVLRRLHFWMIFFRKAMTRITRPEIIGSNHPTNRKGIRKLMITLAKKINFGKVFPYEKQMKKLEKCVTRYLPESSRYIMAYPSIYGAKEIVPRDCYGEAVEGTFEDIKVSLPSQYHRLLTALYADYMQLPPEDKREGHFTKIFNKTHTN